MKKKILLLLCMMMAWGCTSTQAEKSKIESSVEYDIIFQDKEMITQYHLDHPTVLYDSQSEGQTDYIKGENEVQFCVSNEQKRSCQDYSYYEVREDLDYSKSLDELIEQYLNENQAKSTQVSYFYYNTVTQQEIVGNGDLIMLGASTIKVPVAMAYTNFIDEGKVEADQMMYFPSSLYEVSENDLTNYCPMESYVPLDFLMSHMIRYSDNSAVNILLYNYPTYSAIGFREWFASFYPMEYSSSFYYENQITANLQKEVMKELYKNQEKYVKILEDMELAYPSRYIKSSIQDFTVAHKWGYYDIYSHDMAVIDTPQVILVGIFTSSYEQNGEKIVADIADIMVNYTMAHL